MLWHSVRVWKECAKLFITTTGLSNKMFSYSKLKRELYITRVISHLWCCQEYGRWCTHSLGTIFPIASLAGRCPSSVAKWYSQKAIPEFRNEKWKLKALCSILFDGYSALMRRITSKFCNFHPPPLPIFPELFSFNGPPTSDVSLVTILQVVCGRIVAS